MTITVEAVTHIGKVREENQDAITWQHCPEGPFAYFVVADGMGGYSGGAYASKLAIESAQQALSHVRYSDIQNDTPENTTQFLSSLVHDAITKANERIWQEKATAGPELSQMGTTIVVGAIYNNIAVIGNVGDSRAYLYRSSELAQISKDHSIVQELIDSGNFDMSQIDAMNIRDALTRALGIGETVEPFICSQILDTHDIIVACSDGLTKHLTDADISEELSLNLSIQETCFRMLDGALNDGGKDNISIVLAMI